MMDAVTRRKILDVALNVGPPLGAETAASVAAAALDAAEAVARAMELLTSRRAAALVEHRALVAAIEREEVALRLTCRHGAATVHLGTPYDRSYRTCDLCGSEF